MEDPWNPCDPQHRRYMCPGEGTCRVEELACILRDRCPFFAFARIQPCVRFRRPRGGPAALRVLWGRAACNSRMPWAGTETRAPHDPPFKSALRLRAREIALNTLEGPL